MGQTDDRDVEKSDGEIDDELINDKSVWNPSVTFDK